MKTTWGTMVAVTIVGFLLISFNFFQNNDNVVQDVKVIQAYQSRLPGIPSEFTVTNEIKALLEREENGLTRPVIDKILMTLECAQASQVGHNHILTIIDYSLPSSQKRLWVFDLEKKQLLFHTYVSHGLKSGERSSTYFSNRNNSKASSIGVYKTDKTYDGREGTSLVVEGLDRGFNDNAVSRAIVMHSGWYVDEKFIKKYGRAGRSWGCPALPPELAQSIINTIKDQSLFVVYYPSDRWFLTSQFLNCHADMARQYAETETPSVSGNEQRDDVLFADTHQKKPQHEENDLVMVMSADDYPRFFNAPAPLTRMLRRQINHAEYIALSNMEFQHIVNQDNREALNAIYFVSPSIKMVRGYYVTEMKLVSLGKIKEVKINASGLIESIPRFTVYLTGNAAIHFRATHRFVRWVGL